MPFMLEHSFFVQNPAVRKTSIMALQKLYEVDDNVPSLGLFTERFCSRMIELADDIDISVAVTAISLLKHLLRYGYHDIYIYICVCVCVCVCV